MGIGNWFRTLLRLHPPRESGLADPASFFRNHPPRCIAGFHTLPVTLPGVRFDGHCPSSDSDEPVTVAEAENTDSIFLLTCTCGHNKHFVRGYHWRNPDYRGGTTTIFISPLDLQCAACDRITDLLDTDLHGYDAEVGGIPTNGRGLGDFGEFQCRKCGRQPFEVFVRFENFNDVFNEGNGAFSGREQDLFSWFSAVGKCRNCSQLVQIADFECA